MRIYIQKYEIEGQISLFQLNSKGARVSLEENHLKRAQPLPNIYFIKIGKRGRGSQHSSPPFLFSPISLHSKYNDIY